MTSKYQDQADLRLLPQIRAATDSGAEAVFVPGNHDWTDGADEGYDAILAQADYVNSWSPGVAGFIPSDGCPGPVAVDRYEGVRIIIVDTQWWLHGGEKPGPTCAHPDMASVVTSFAALLDTDRHVVIAAHHPLFGYGRHTTRDRFIDCTEQEVAVAHPGLQLVRIPSNGGRVSCSPSTRSRPGRHARLGCRP